jgi:hypothetical protein
MPPGKCARPGVFLAGTRGALGTGALSGRRGSRTPKGLRPTRFRDGVPRLWQSFRIGGDTGSDVRFTVELLSHPQRARNGSSRDRTCTSPGKSRELCRLSYGAKGDVAGRNRTCALPGFNRALYLLSYSHEVAERTRAPPVGQSRKATCRIARACCSVFMSTRCQP